MNKEVANEKAVRFLAASLKTKQEVKEKLKKIGCEDEIIEEVISHLEELSYINDEEYVEAYLRQEKKMQKYSTYEIINKLRIKGISSELLEKAKESLENDNYDEIVKNKIIEKKKKIGEDELKIKNYLYRRGF